MRRTAIGLGLALSLLGCGGPAPTPAPTRGEQVPLRTATAEEQPGTATFANVVADVVADPDTGTPIIVNDDTYPEPMRWPSGYTAWRVGSETEVLDTTGKTVLVTGQRYRLYPSYNSIIADVKPCPQDPTGSTCVLGFHLDER